MSTDHLAEARRLADKVYRSNDDAHTENLATAIEHLADAIEALQPTVDAELIVPVFSKCPRCGVEHTDLPGKLCYHCGLDGPAQPDAVPVLLPEHRDRVWTDYYGNEWRWAMDELSVGDWEWRPPQPGWRRGITPGTGPFTAVEEA